MSACEDGVFVTPSRLTPQTRQQAALGRTTPGASYASHRPETPAEDEDEDEDSGSVRFVAPTPPPLWQVEQRKPAEKAVVTGSDREDLSTSGWSTLRKAAGRGHPEGKPHIHSLLPMAYAIQGRA